MKLILAVMSGSFCSFLDLHRVLLHSSICFTFTVAIPYSETSPRLRSTVIINFRVKTVYIIIRWRHTRSQTPLMSSPFHTNTLLFFIYFPSVWIFHIVLLLSFHPKLFTSWTSHFLHPRREFRIRIPSDCCSSAASPT